MAAPTKRRRGRPSAAMRAQATAIMNQRLAVVETPKAEALEVEPARTYADIAEDIKLLVLEANGRISVLETRMSRDAEERDNLYRAVGGGNHILGNDGQKSAVATTGNTYQIR